MGAETRLSIWQIDRNWLVSPTAGEVENRTTSDLARFRGLVLLGAAGAGKTIEARRLAEQERESGMSIRECRLAEYAGSSDELRQQLTALADSADTKTAFYLDALDEAMIPLRRSGLAVKGWIIDQLRGTGSSLRITCRSAVWPSFLSAVMREFVGEQAFATALLQALSDDDIAVAASSMGIESRAFLSQVEDARAQSLAKRPLTLRMLLRLHQFGGGLPPTLRELLAAGLLTLATDTHERFEIGTEVAFSPNDFLAAAERLACYTILTGRETVDLGDESPPDHLNWLSIVGLGDGEASLSRVTLRALGSSGLCDSAHPASFRFGHRQFAEYLAGQRLARLLPHQARSLLASPAGWKAGVAGPLRETAAFAAMANSDVAEWLASWDPEVVGLSDVADHSLRRQAMLGLLDRFRRGDMTDAQVRPGEIELRGFQYDNADADLRPVLRERDDRCEDVLECAINLIRSWKLSSMSDDLADLALDSAAPLQSRLAAGYALFECGTDAARGRLKLLLVDSPGDERAELRGVALQCNWPDRLSVPELLDTLTARRNPGFHGAYEGFLWKLDEHGFAAASHVAHGLRWARARFSQLGDVDLVHRIGMRIAHAALRELDDPGVAAELLSLLRHWAVNNRSPLGQLPNKEQREASILEAIGEQGPNPSRHIDFVWLSVKPNSRVKPADAAAFREQVLALVRDCDRRWPIERFWRTGHRLTGAELNHYAVLARHLNAVTLWPKDDRPSDRDWILFPVRGGSFDRDTMCVKGGAKLDHRGGGKLDH